MIDDLRFVLSEVCPNPNSSTNRTVQDAYVDELGLMIKPKSIILSRISDVLTKKHEGMVTAKEIMDSLQAMFGQSSSSVTHDALKYIYNSHMKEGTSVREHVLDMMVHFCHTPYQVTLLT